MSNIKHTHTQTEKPVLLERKQVFREHCYSGTTSKRHTSKAEGQLQWTWNSSPKPLIMGQESRFGQSACWVLGGHKAAGHDASTPGAPIPKNWWAPSQWESVSGGRWGGQKTLPQPPQAPAYVTGVYTHTLTHTPHSQTDKWWQKYSTHIHWKLWWCSKEALKAQYGGHVN